MRLCAFAALRLCVKFLRLDGLDLFHPHLLDPAVIDLFDLENMAVKRHCLSLVQKLTRFGHQETGDRRVALGNRHIHLETPVKVTDGKAAVEQIAAIRLRIDLFVYLFVMLVRDVADYLLEQVFERDDAFDAAVFIDYKAEMELFRCICRSTSSRCAVSTT